MWNTTEAPKDRTIVAVGQIIMVNADGLTAVEPFCTAIKWHPSAECWVNQDDLAIATNYDDTVKIFHWAEMPERAEAAWVLEHGMAKL